MRTIISGEQNAPISTVNPRILLLLPNDHRHFFQLTLMTPDGNQPQAWELGDQTNLKEVVRTIFGDGALVSAEFSSDQTNRAIIALGGMLAVDDRNTVTGALVELLVARYYTLMVVPGV
jgi:hypothetical protein